jgi:alpha-tubulin suppressor-like RCC1 family protein
VELGGGWKGVLGTGYQSRENPQVIPNMTDFIEVASGSEHVLALRKDGTVWSWGDNEKGALGYKEDGVPYGPPNDIRFRPHQLTPKQIPNLKDIVNIAAGSSFSLALDKQGRVWGWGSSAYILKNVFDKTTQKEPKVVYEDKNIAKIISRSTETSIIFNDGTAIIFSAGSSEMFDDVKENTLLTDYRIYRVPFNDVVDISMTGLNLYTLLRKDGTVWTLGMNAFGALGQCDYKRYKGFVRVKNLSRIKKINTTIAWDEEGYLWHWGVNIYEKRLLKQLVGNYYNGHEPCPIRGIKKTDLSFFVDGRVNQANKVIGLDNGQVLFLEERRSKKALHPLNWSWK